MQSSHFNRTVQTSFEPIIHYAIYVDYKLHLQLLFLFIHFYFAQESKCSLSGVFKEPILLKSKERMELEMDQHLDTSSAVMEGVVLMSLSEVRLDLKTKVQHFPVPVHFNSILFP